MWNAQPPFDHNHAGQLAISAPENRCFGVSSGKSVDILDDPSVLAGPIDGKCLSIYASSVTRKMDDIESVLLNDGRITPPSSFSELTSVRNAPVLVNKKHQQTPETLSLIRPRPSYPKSITPSPSCPNPKTKRMRPVRLEMSEMATDMVTLGYAKLNY